VMFCPPLNCPFSTLPAKLNTLLILFYF
jgi:hypothetical protein